MQAALPPASMTARAKVIPRPRPPPVTTIVLFLSSNRLGKEVEVGRGSLDSGSGWAVGAERAMSLFAAGGAMVGMLGSDGNNSKNEGITREEKEEK